MACLAVALTFTAIPLYGSEAVAKDKGQIQEVVFIHHKLPFDFDRAKPDNPGKPTKPVPVTCSETADDSVDHWGSTGWSMSGDGLTYKINYGTVPGNVADTDFQNVIAASTSTWSQADSGLRWTDEGATNIKRSALDGTNLIAFGNAMGGIAVTRTWYYVETGEIVESDMIFSKGVVWSIIDASAGDCAGVPGTYDVQNIATHEFGHQVGLIDLYTSTDRDLTMYGYGDMAELKKDSLSTGDIIGAQTLAP